MPFRTKFFREQEHNQESLQGITHKVLYIIKKLLDMQWNGNLWTIVKKKKSVTRNRFTNILNVGIHKYTFLNIFDKYFIKLRAKW